MTVVILSKSLLPCLILICYNRLYSKAELNPLEKSRFQGEDGNEGSCCAA